MKAKDEISAQKIQVINLEDLADLEELETREAPCADGTGMHPLTGCHNHNETFRRDI